MLKKPLKDCVVPQIGVYSRVAYSKDVLHVVDKIQICGSLYMFQFSFLY